MITFDTVQDYLRACQGRELAALPYQLAADALGVTRAAVDGMVRRGALEAVKIGKDRLVLVASLLARKKAEQEQIAKIRAYLEGRIKEKCGAGAQPHGLIVFYAPVMQHVGLNYKVPADRGKIGHLLGELSRQTWHEKHILLSAIVHQQKTGKTNPGRGFFNLAKEPGINLTWKDNDAFVDQQVKRVFEAYRGGRPSTSRSASDAITPSEVA